MDLRREKGEEKSKRRKAGAEGANKGTEEYKGELLPFDVLAQIRPLLPRLIIFLLLSYSLPSLLHEDRNCEGHVRLKAQQASPRLTHPPENYLVSW